MSRKILAAAILFFTVFFLNGCSSDPVSNLSNNLQGRVIDLYNSPLNGAKVMVDGNIVYTREDGRFNFNFEKTTYDLAIQYGNSYHYYEDLTLNENIFTITLIDTIYTGSTARVHINFPIVPQDHRAIIFYSDGEKAGSTTSLYSGSSESGLYLDWENGNRRIFKLVYLLFRLQDNIITSYERYGKKEILISNGEVVNLSFSESDISTNPEENLITVQPNTPFPSAGNNQAQLYIYASTNYNFRSGIYLSQTSSNTFDFLYPDLPEITSYKIYFSSLHQSFDTRAYVNEFFNKGTSLLTLNLEQPISLITPTNNSTNVNHDTEFKLSDLNIGGVYVYSFQSNPVRNILYIYSSNSTIQIPDLSQMGFVLNQSESFQWHASMHRNFNNLDDYLKRFNSGEKISTSGSQTTWWYFTVGN